MPIHRNCCCDPVLYVDSDDDAEGLVGRRIQVSWSRGKRYKGTVIAYSADTSNGREDSSSFAPVTAVGDDDVGVFEEPVMRLHRVRYDDGEEKSYTLANAYSARSVQWEILPPEPKPEK